MRIVSKILATIVFGLICFIALSPLGAAVTNGSGSAPTIMLLAVLILMGVLVFWAPTGRRAWGRGSLVAGVCFVALPLSMLVLSGQAVQEVVAGAPVDEAGMATVGASIGAGLAVGASAFFGFIFGTIFIVTGLVLVLGGRREVVIVER